MLDLSKCKPEYLQYKTYHNRHKSDCRNIFNYEHFLIWLINSSQSKQAASLNKNLGLETLWRRQWHPTPVLLPGKIPRMEEPGRLQSMGSLRVGHDWAASLSLSTFMHWRRKWQPTPVFLPGESQGWGSLVGCRLWGRTGSDTTKAT